MPPCAMNRKPPGPWDLGSVWFFGLLHMEIIQERIEREYNIPLITTAPSVVYHVHTTDGTMLEIENPTHMPPQQKVDHVEEPYVKASIMVPNDYVGAVMELCQTKRGEYIDMQYLDANRVNIVYELPFGRDCLRLFRPAEIRH